MTTDPVVCSECWRPVRVYEYTAAEMRSNEHLPILQGVEASASCGWCGPTWYYVDDKWVSREERRDHFNH